MGLRVGNENWGDHEMRIVCYQCHREIGEKAPFSDNRTTHVLCEPCLRQLLKNLSDKRRSKKERVWRFDSIDVNV